MTRRNGEVAVKRDGHVHAISAPELPGPVTVDVDADHVSLPPETQVSFQDPGSDADVEDAAADIAVAMGFGMVVFTLIDIFAPETATIYTVVPSMLPTVVIAVADLFGFADSPSLGDAEEAPRVTRPRPAGIAVSDGFERYLRDLRRTVHFPRCASLRNRGSPGLNPGVRFS